MNTLFARTGYFSFFSIAALLVVSAALSSGCSNKARPFALDAPALAPLAQQHRRTGPPPPPGPPARPHSSDMLGVNMGYEPEHEHVGAARFGYYCLNRFDDFVDIFTFNMGIGPIAHAEIHITQFLRFGLGAGWQFTAGMSEVPREGGFWARGFAEASFGPLQAGFIKHDRFAGPIGNYDDSHGGFMSPRDPLYHEKRDYWSIGASGGFPFWGGQFAVHPIQFGDWIAGWFGFDPLHDDY